LNEYTGAPHGYEKNLLRPCWSPNDDYIAVGSGDRSVVIFEKNTRNIVYKLPGHKGCVNEVDWVKNIIVSSSNDRTCFIGEIDTSELE
jgi:Prp8 binding protein